LPLFLPLPVFSKDRVLEGYLSREGDIALTSSLQSRTSCLSVLLTLSMSKSVGRRRRLGFSGLGEEWRWGPWECECASSCDCPGGCGWPCGAGLSSPSPGHSVSVRRSPFVGKQPVRQQTFISRLIGTLLKFCLILFRVVFEYFRIGHYLLQKGGVREYRVVHF
jgi:hypothetical protein